ncbi:MAG: glutaredoxin [Oceanicoccus sp.]|jgi:glutaredoxin
MNKLILYSTSACHLCEQAKALLEPMLGAEWQLEELDISESDELIERYGIRIPVLLRVADNGELGWPFDQQQIAVFLQIS